MQFKLVTLVFVLIMTAGSTASAQTMSLAVDDNGVLTRSYEVTSGEIFNVVTLVDTGGHDISAVEWYQTPIELGPGVLKLGFTSLCGGPCDVTLEALPPGLYLTGLGGCFTGAADLELLRVEYLDIGFFLQDDVVLSIRGLEPGDYHSPSSFDGDPGFVDCDDLEFAAIMSGGDAWQTGSGVVVPSGALVLNPTAPLVVGAAGDIVSQIKARYRQ